MNCNQKKGFITIATGDLKYYIMARNLLFSYRLFAKNPLSFALIADEENEYTKEFDELVLLKDANQSYMDKLKLYHYTPYYETIFIDADSLAYQDLNIYWDYFKTADDFSCFGKVLYDLDTTEGWFKRNDIAEYKDKIKFIIDLHGGIYYFRKTLRCKSIFDLASCLASNYNKYNFKDFTEPADEPVIALSMTLHNCKPIEYDHKLLYFPVAKKVQIDIARQRLDYVLSRDKNEKVTSCMLIHWANLYTSRALYKFEVDKLMLMHSRAKKSILDYIYHDMKIKFFYYKLIDWSNDLRAINKYVLSRLLKIRSSI